MSDFSEVGINSECSVEAVLRGRIKHMRIDKFAIACKNMASFCIFAHGAKGRMGTFRS